MAAGIACLACTYACGGGSPTGPDARATFVRWNYDGKEFFASGIKFARAFVTANPDFYTLALEAESCESRNYFKIWMHAERPLSAGTVDVDVYAGDTLTVFYWPPPSDPRFSNPYFWTAFSDPRLSFPGENGNGWIRFSTLTDSEIAGSFSFELISHFLDEPPQQQFRGTFRAGLGSSLRCT